MSQPQDAILLREAVAAAKAGNKASARQLLRQASAYNTENELVWLWRASLAETPKEAIFCLNEVLRINPLNQKALTWLEKCKGHAAAGAPRAGGPAQPAAQQPAPAAAAQTEPATPAPTAAHGNESLLAAAKNIGIGSASPVQVQPVETAPASPSGGVRPADSSARSLETALKPGEVPLRPRPSVIPFVPPASRTSPAPAIEPQAAPKWKCPFCGHTSESEVRKCPHCRAITVLEDLKEIEKNEGVQERLVRAALARYEATPADKRTFEHNLYLALGHLNLREATAALPHLKAAAAQKRNDWALMGVLDQIQWRKVILVVDDSLTIRKALSAILERNEYRVVTAEDGSDALAKLTEAVPDLVLLDITMPWMDGYQVCKAIKEKALTRKVPVIMLSGKDGIFDKMRGKLAGCNDYITKPFDPDALLKMIKKYLA